jgi:hypothetical protein
VSNLLKGIITDPEGRPMMPVHSKKGSKQYRYYITRLKPGDDKARAIRVPARDLERLVLNECVTDLLNWKADGTSDAEHIEILANEAAAAADGLKAASIQKQRKVLLDLGAAIQLFDEHIEVAIKLSSDDETHTCKIDAKLVRRGMDLRFASAPGNGQTVQDADPVLVRLLAHGIAAQRHLLENQPTAMVEGYTRRHLNRLAKLSYLAPDIIASIMAGTQPPQLTGRKLLRMPHLPNEWADQRKQLGF